MRTLPDDKLAAAIAKKLVGTGAGHEKIEELRGIARGNSTALVRIETVGKVVSEVDALRDVVSMLAAEVQAFRANVQIERDAPPPSNDVCGACRKFRRLQSVFAHVPPVDQALLTSAGACCASSPMANKDAGPNGAVFTSVFKPVDPGQWCAEFERRDPDAGTPA